MRVLTRDKDKLFETRKKIKIDTTKGINNKLKLFKVYIYNILENETSPNKQIYDIFALFVVITSSISIFLEYIPSVEKRIPPDLNSFFNNYETFALYFFLIEYILRWWVISDFWEDFTRAYNEKKNILLALIEAFKPKVKWMFTLYAIIDLLSILPLFRPFRAFRILRVIRILKIIRYGGTLKSLFIALKEHSFLFAFIYLSLAGWIFSISLIVYIYEYNAGNKLFSNMWDAVYWGLITVATVGYGDITPITPEGKFFASLLVGGGIALVSALTGTFSAALVGRLLDIKGGELKLPNLENHIVICGWNETAEEVVEQIISLGIEKEKGVVVITNVPKSEIGIELPSFIGYKKGDFIQDNILMDVSIDKASDVIIVAEREEGLSERNIDARTALAAMIISNINPSANIYVEVLLDEDADIFKRRMRVKEVLIHGQLIGKMLFAGILNPGTTDLVKTLIDKETGIKKIKVSNLGRFENFGQLLIAMREKGYLPIAIERKGVIKLNPEDTFILEKNDYVFLI